MFLEEQLFKKKYGIEQVSVSYKNLLGSMQGHPVHGLGFVQFLISIGIKKPNQAHLSSNFIGRYWEYVTIYYGTHESACCMKSLRDFWFWCQSSGYVSKKVPLPPDLKNSSLNKNYSVSIQIKEMN